MAIGEDRRRLTQRLTTLRVSIGAAFGLLACGFWFFQVVQHAQFKEMAENNHQRTRHPAGAARHHLRPHRQTAGRESQLLQYFDCSRAHEGSRSHDSRAVAGDRRRRESRARYRREKPPRAELSPDRRRPGRHALAGRRGHGAPPRFRAARRDGAGGADPAVSRSGHGRAPDRLRRRSQRRSDAVRRCHDGIDRRSVRRRARLQQAVDG